jgi:hypothetical protein
MSVSFGVLQLSYQVTNPIFSQAEIRQKQATSATGVEWGTLAIFPFWPRWGNLRDEWPLRGQSF